MPKLPDKKKRPWQMKSTSRLKDNSTFYHSKQWRSLRNYYIQMHPLCEVCKRKDIITSGEVVDHIKPINMGGHKIDVSNLQTMCHSCHNSKRGKEAWEWRK